MTELGFDPNMFGNNNQHLSPLRSCRGMNRVAWLRRDILLSVLLGLSLFAGAAVVAESDGISGTTVASGCVCHGGGTASDDVTVTLEGLPLEYAAEQTYTLTLTIIGGPAEAGSNSGGFNLDASAGTLLPIDSSTQTESEQLTHTSDGNDVRTWQFTWVAPKFGSVTFTGYGNAVDGDGVAGAGDTWNSFSTTVAGPPAPSEPVGFYSAGDELPDYSFYMILGMVAMTVIVILQRRSDRL